MLSVRLVAELYLYVLNLFSLADGAHCAHFWRCLSEAYTTGEISSSPDYDRSYLDSADPLARLAASNYSPSPFKDTTTPVYPNPGTNHLRILITDDQLSSLKKSVTMQTHSDHSVSTQDCLSASLAVALTRARKGTSNFPPITRLLNLVDVSSFIFIYL